MVIRILRSTLSLSSRRRASRRLGALLVSTLALPFPTAAQTPSWIDVELDALQLRAMGPYRAGSWVTDIAVPSSSGPPTTFYVAARHGGVWKTTNLGTTFENITDADDIAAVGDIAVAPSDA